MQEMKIGELAKETGLSVRTLHHYDEIGLLRPTFRSEGEHRVYTKMDIERLQKIISLKKIGFSLEQIQVSLRTEPSLSSILQKHIDFLEEDIFEKQQLLNRIKATIELTKLHKDLEIDTLLNSIREVVSLEKVFNKNQIEQIVTNSRELGKVKVDALIQELIQIISKIKNEKINHTPPESPSVLALTQRWIQIRNFFTKDNPEFVDAIQNSKIKINEIGADYGVDKDLLDYVQESANYLKEKNE
jgi:MerR family transcriptional regulator, thiopeptide resistance regulator